MRSVQGLRRLLQSDREAIHQTVERLLLVTAFEHCDRNQVRTAKRLGLSRNIVRAQLKRHGLLEQSSAGDFSSAARNSGVALGLKRRAYRLPRAGTPAGDGGVPAR